MIFREKIHKLLTGIFAFHSTIVEKTSMSYSESWLQYVTTTPKLSLHRSFTRFCKLPDIFYKFLYDAYKT